MDRLHGTDETFRRSKSYNRNIILFGFTSAREMFPDSLKQKQNGQSSARGVHVPAVNEVSYPS